MYGRSDVNVKVERGSTFTFTRGFSATVEIHLKTGPEGKLEFKFFPSPEQFDC